MTSSVDSWTPTSDTTTTHTIEKMVVEGPDVWALYTVEGTHRGPLRGVEPSGRMVRYPIVAMYQVADEHITEADFVSDDLRMMRQLGAVAT